MIFYASYITHHPDMAKMAGQYPFLPAHPRLAMLITGPVFGVASGLILGLFAFIASKIVAKKAAVN
jgi:hypothetical protein